MRLTTSFRQFVSYSAVIILAIVTAFTIYISQAGAASNDEAHNGRLITFHDRGEKRVILTHAQNVRDALKDADIAVVEEDIVEPGLSEPLVAADYTVNIYRARPVIVVDGMVRQKVMTAAQTVEGISEAAGVKLHDQDIGELSLSTDIVADGAGVIMTIDRATKFTLNLYGTETTAYSQAETVGEMIKEKNIQLGPNDDVSVDTDAQLTAGMTVSIWRDGVQTTTVEEGIAFPVRQIQDVDQPTGYRKVQTPGTNGRKMVTYEVTMKDGKVVKKVVIQTVVIAQPKEQVEIVGAKFEGPEEIIAKIRAAAARKGIDATRVLNIAKCESGFNPQADSGYYKGIFQHDPQYWAGRAARYGFSGASIFDVEAQIGVSTSMMAEGGWSHWGCDPGA